MISIKLDNYHNRLAICPSASSLIDCNEVRYIIEAQNSVDCIDSTCLKIMGFDLFNAYVSFILSAVSVLYRELCDCNGLSLCIQ